MVIPIHAIDLIHAIDYTIGTALSSIKYMHITSKTRQEISKLINEGYNKGFAHDANDNVVIWEITIKLEL